jgi:hypothetical protein
VICSGDDDTDVSGFLLKGGHKHFSMEGGARIDKNNNLLEMLRKDRGSSSLVRDVAAVSSEAR